MRKKQSRAIARTKARAAAKQQQAGERTQSAPPPPRLSLWRRMFGWLAWSIPLGWAAVLAIGNAVQFVLPYRPHVTIQAGISVDSKDPLATPFIFTNVGGLPVYDLIFGCTIDPGNTTVSESVPGQETVAVLLAGDSVTRDCAFRSVVDPKRSTPFLMPLGRPDQTVLRPFVNFTWPVIGTTDHVEIRYSARPNRDTGGYLLVPNATGP